MNTSLSQFKNNTVWASSIPYLEDGAFLSENLGKHTKTYKISAANMAPNGAKEYAPTSISYYIKYETNLLLPSQSTVRGNNKPTMMLHIQFTALAKATKNIQS